MGTRLRPLTHTTPKHLLPIAGKPVIQYAAEKLHDAGIKDVCVVVGHMRQMVESFLGDGKKFGLNITYAVQEEQLGIAHGIGCAKSFVGNSDFVVYLGDNLVQDRLNAYAESFSTDRECEAMILLSKVRAPERFGVPTIASDGTIIRLTEKPDAPKSQYAVAGIYFLRPSFFNQLERLKPSRRGLYEIIDALQLFVEEKKLRWFEIQGWWADSGRPEDLLEANQLILKTSNHATEHVPRGAGTELDEHTSIVGPVYIGSHCVIGRSEIGPYASVEDHSRIRSGRIVNSIIYQDCTIDIAGLRLRDSVIGSHSVVEASKEVPPRDVQLIVGEYSRITLS